MKGVSCVFLLLALVVAARAEARQSRATIVYEEVATDVRNLSEDPNQLWISTADLKRSTHFEVKPQGVCREELCFPLPKPGRQAFVRRRGVQELFNLTAFARLVHQPVAHQTEPATWYFGQRSDQQQKLASLEAPDFTLPDTNGKPHSLSQFHGKKILLVTWASW